MSNKEISLYLNIAKEFSKLSKADKLKVGACLVTKTGVILGGVNGTPTGLDNKCEDYTEDGLVTRPEVLHAEKNAILKAAREGVSVMESTMYLTHSPCVQCASMLIQAGVKKVYYRLSYRCDSGLKLLDKAGIEQKQILE